MTCRELCDEFVHVCDSLRFCFIHLLDPQEGFREVEGLQVRFESLVVSEEQVIFFALRKG